MRVLAGAGRYTQMREGLSGAADASGGRGSLPRWVVGRNKIFAPLEGHK